MEIDRWFVLPHRVLAELAQPQDGLGIKLVRIAAQPVDRLFGPVQQDTRGLVVVGLALPDPPPVVYVTGTQEGRIAVAALRAFVAAVEGAAP